MGGYALEIKIELTALMSNYSFSTLSVAIFQQCYIDNQNIFKTNNHMFLSCVRDYIPNF